MPYGPPQEVRAVIKRDNPKAKPIPLPAAKPARGQVANQNPPVQQHIAPVVPMQSAEELLQLTQQDAVDLVFALTEAIEAASANVQRWASKGDAHRADAALMQARRFEGLRDRVAAQISKLARK
jgi:hypothetical protein